MTADVTDGISLAIWYYGVLGVSEMRCLGYWKVFRERRKSLTFRFSASTRIDVRRACGAVGLVRYSARSLGRSRTNYVNLSTVRKFDYCASFHSKMGADQGLQHVLFDPFCISICRWIPSRHHAIPFDRSIIFRFPPSFCFRRLLVKQDRHIEFLTVARHKSGTGSTS